jgi:hypothetical protein
MKATTRILTSKEDNGAGANSDVDCGRRCCVRKRAESAVGCGISIRGVLKVCLQAVQGTRFNSDFSEFIRTKTSLFLYL